MPPLRDRAEDIPLLVTHFVAKYSARMRKVIERIRAEVMDTLTFYSWPGNDPSCRTSSGWQRNTDLRVALSIAPGPTGIGHTSSHPEEPITLEEDLNREHIRGGLQQTRGVIMGPNERRSSRAQELSALPYMPACGKLGISRSNKIS